MVSGKRKSIAVIGAGPAGLMAAERLAAGGHRVTVFDRMPSVARKFLMAGRGGLNLTHSEPLEKFLTRYGEGADPRLLAAVERFPPDAAIAWAAGLGQTTFVGTSGRVFPTSMKASPLLRAWLARLGQLRVLFQLRSTWTGSGAGGIIQFESGGLPAAAHFDAVVLALGGASWPRLGSDGGWVSLLAEMGIDVASLQPDNAGVQVKWSDHLRQRCAGKPLKRIGVGIEGALRKVRGEAIIADYGLEAGAIYALGETMRTQITAGKQIFLEIDLKPDISVEALAAKLAWAPVKLSLANTLRKLAGLDAVAIALLHETVRSDGPLPRDVAALAARIKCVRVPVEGFAPIERAISTAGGVSFAELDDHFMLRKRPGTFVAGEMLNWSAPTGGYLLQACLATGVAAADGVIRWLARDDA